MFIEIKVSESLVSSALAPEYATQRAGEQRPFTLDASSLSVPAWQPLVSVPASSFIRPSEEKATGFVYQSAADGQTGSEEPAWSTSLSDQTTDGSVVWDSFAPPAPGQDTLASVSWDQESPPDAQLTVTMVETTSLSTSAVIGGGTQGETYLVVVGMTMSSGPIYKQPIYINVI